MEGGFVINPLDIIIAGLIGFGMYRGATKGVIKRATLLVSIVISVILGARLRHIAETLYLDYLQLSMPGEMVLALSFATAFVISYIVVSTLLGYLTQGLGKVNIKIDNALGALFGGTIATLALSIALVLLSYVNFPSAANAQGSMLYPHVKNFARYSLGVGVGVLREGYQQMDKYGVGVKKAPDNNPTTPAQPSNTNKPKAIR